LVSEEVDPLAQTAEYQDEIDSFIITDLGAPLWERQRDIAHSIEVNPATAVRSCHAAGKSFVAARLALAFLHTRPHSVVITTAPTARQVQNVLWRYINTAALTSVSPLLGRSLNVRYEIAPDWYAIGFTGDKNGGSTMQGFHAENLLLVVDEAAGVAEAVFEEAESILTGAGARALYIGNPTSLGGTFRSAFHENSDLYEGIRISAYDTPNFTRFGITRDDMLNGEWKDKITGSMPYPALIDPFWVNRQIRRHGPKSPFVISRIDAEFPTDSASTLIALSWIERAQEAAGTLHDPTAPWYAGIDVARFGEDETSIALRQGDELGPQDSWNGLSTTESRGRIEYWLGELGIKKDQIELRVDVIGVGGGLHDELKANGWKTKQINVGAASRDKKLWPNFRHEMWWQLRERFKDDRIATMEPSRFRLPDGEWYDARVDEGAQAQLSDIKFRYDESGKYQMPLIESKEAAKKRGRPSPDRAEAVAMAFCQPPRGEGRTMARVRKSKGNW
jgi:hypothetical protein